MLVLSAVSLNFPVPKNTTLPPSELSASKGCAVIGWVTPPAAVNSGLPENATPQVSVAVPLKSNFHSRPFKSPPYAACTTFCELTLSFTEDKPLVVSVLSMTIFLISEPSRTSTTYNAATPELLP
ncbi:hypothetical protein D3C87_1744100 [compost metagenome]